MKMAKRKQRKQQAPVPPTKSRRTLPLEKRDDSAAADIEEEDRNGNKAAYNDPSTRAPLRAEDLAPNRSLRDAILSCFGPPPPPYNADAAARPPENEKDSDDSSSDDDSDNSNSSMLELESVDSSEWSAEDELAAEWPEAFVQVDLIPGHRFSCLGSNEGPGQALTADEVEKSGFQDWSWLDDPPHGFESGSGWLMFTTRIKTPRALWSLLSQQDLPPPIVLARCILIESFCFSLTLGWARERWYVTGAAHSTGIHPSVFCSPLMRCTFGLAFASVFAAFPLARLRFHRDHARDHANAGGAAIRAASRIYRESSSFD